MRLLNTSTLRLKEFYDAEIPPYGILSHRWENEEVSFQEMLGGAYHEMASFLKIRGCCRQADLDGFEWVWIDSCCIDKTSSSELSEAINSMFRWYQEAKVCYAYLSDVPNGRANHHALYSTFRQSKWFTRGWTLQELLAPMTLVFYDQKWVEIGTKSSLEKLISSITRIRNINRWEDASIAQKMSWASMRQTTRIEDTAYCLLGIFGVNMPLLYGEGQKAFIRLQFEILKQSDDESIFAWSWPADSFEQPGGGLLAISPAEFMNSGHIERHIFDEQRPSYSMTNKGLRIELHLMSTGPTGAATKQYIAPINCSIPNDGRPAQLAIELFNTTRDQYTRTAGYQILPLPVLAYNQRDITRRVVHVPQPDKYKKYVGSHKLTFLFRAASAVGCGFWVGKTYLNAVGSRWADDEMSHQEQKLNLFRGSRCGGDIIFQNGDAEMFSLKVDIVDDRPGVHLRIFNDFPDLLKRQKGFQDQRSSVDRRSINFDPYLSPWTDSDYASLTKLPFPNRRIDRVSKRLASGHSVSVVLRPSTMKDQDAHSGYVVEITVDPTGSLRWPEE